MILKKDLPWIYANDLVLHHDCINIADTENKHLTRVLRCKSNDQVAVFNGTGSIREGILQFNKKCNTIKFTDKLIIVPTNKISLQLIICLPNHTDTFEKILKCACELGIQTIYPVFSERSERKHWNLINSTCKINRFNRILIESCKQAKNPFLPIILQPIDLNQLPQQKLGMCVYGNVVPQIDRNSKIANNTQLISFIIGPEGGFTESEECMLAKFSSPINLPTFILRIETAVICMTTYIKSFFKNC